MLPDGCGKGRRRAVAERIYDRHRTLEAVLVSLGVERKQAEKDACKVEHDLSDESFAAIRAKWLQTQSEEADRRE